MNEAMARKPAAWPRWLVYLGALLAIGGPVLAVAMALATGAGMIGWETGLGSLRSLLMVTVAGLVLTIVGLIIVLFGRRWPLLKWGLLAAVVSGAFLAYVGVWLGQMSAVPPIHDVSTDLTTPPEFAVLELRADNREAVPPGIDPRMAALDNAMRWRLYHTEAYGDIRPIIVPTSVPDTVAAAEQLVEDRGWTLATSNAAAGRVEATETVSLYGFRDDVVLRIVPNADGPGSIVDMRSVSRVGVSDLGVNAERVREFLADLQAATGQ